MNTEISIIIVNYNSHSDIKNCLASLYSNTKDVNYEIIIVDNNSPERGIDALRNNYDNVQLFQLESNFGFGTACNYGANKAIGKYLVFVNPDTVFTDNCLKVMYDFMENAKDAATCTPAFVNPEGQIGYVFNYFPDIIWEIYDFLGKGYKIRANKFNDIIVSAAEKRKPLKVDWTTAACLMVRNEIFQKVSGFDKDYFLYFEDVDLQKRITDAGWNIYCLPYIKVIHLANTSTKHNNDDSVYYFNMNKSRLIYHSKNSSYFKRVFVKYLQLTGFYLRLLFLKFRSRYSDKKIMKQLQYRKIIKYYMSGID